MARTPAKKTVVRRGPRAGTKRAVAAKAAVAKAPVAASAAPSAAPAPAPAPPAAGSVDLAGGLRQLLTAIETEVRAVSTLSEQIDALVGELNGVRDEQAKRLLVLDALRTSVDDAGLTSFLDKAIRPRRQRVAEVVPERLSQ
jgi:hypothetical protein